MQRTKPENLSDSLNVRLPRNVIETLDGVCQRLDLERSEVARRALREGLKTFRDAKLPGVEVQRHG
jgi:metal-responsive CopG/Arc/MetJ family transcriptional regulator